MVYVQSGRNWLSAVATTLAILASLLFNHVDLSLIRVLGGGLVIKFSCFTGTWLELVCVGRYDPGIGNIYASIIQSPFGYIFIKVNKMCLYVTARGSPQSKFSCGCKQKWSYLRSKI